MAETMYLVSNNQLSSIGNSIRSKLGESTTYTVDEMPSKISSIGGSDSGNFKLAHTLVTYTGNSSIEVRCPHTISDYDDYTYSLLPLDTYEPTATIEVIVPVNGKALFEKNNGFAQTQITVSGDAMYRRGVVYISGDCEITISDGDSN